MGVVCLLGETKLLWGRMYRSGETALQADCVGCNSLRFHHFGSRTEQASQRCLESNWSHESGLGCKSSLTRQRAKVTYRMSVSILPIPEDIDVTIEDGASTVEIRRTKMAEGVEMVTSEGSTSEGKRTVAIGLEGPGVDKLLGRTNATAADDLDFGDTKLGQASCSIDGPCESCQ